MPRRLPDAPERPHARLLRVTSGIAIALLVAVLLLAASTLVAGTG